MRVKTTTLAIALLLSLNLWANEEPTTEGRNESNLLSYIENAQQVAWQKEKNTYNVKPSNDWWKSPMGMAGVATTSLLVAYLLFILRRKRWQRKAEEQTALNESCANDVLWVCTNNPGLRITADQLSEALERMQEAPNHKQRIDDYTIN